MYIILLSLFLFNVISVGAMQNPEDKTDSVAFLNQFIVPDMVLSSRLQVIRKTIGDRTLQKLVTIWRDQDVENLITQMHQNKNDQNKVECVAQYYHSDDVHALVTVKEIHDSIQFANITTQFEENDRCMKIDIPLSDFFIVMCNKQRFARIKEQRRNCDCIIS